VSGVANTGLFVWQTKSLLPCHFLNQVIDLDNHALSTLRYLVMDLLRRQPTPRPPTSSADQEAARQECLAHPSPPALGESRLLDDFRVVAM
jgi:hypothetical protein